MRHGGLAQLVEHLLCKQGVTGSSPVTSTTPGAPRKIEDFVGKRKSKGAGGAFAKGGSGVGELVMTRANSSAG